MSIFSVRIKQDGASWLVELMGDNFEEYLSFESEESAYSYIKKRISEVNQYDRERIKGF